MKKIISVNNLNLYKNQRLKIGFLGGSFDPPHQGHLHIALNALEELKLDEVWLSVAKQNPFKENHKYSFNERLRLTEKLIEGHANLKVLSIEDELNILYTIEIIEHLTKKLSNIEFYFIIGADLAKSIHTWGGYEKIIDLAKLVIFSRSGYSQEVESSQIIQEYQNSGKVSFIQIDEIDISSTKIRNETK